jgi:hypothetical protein
MEARIGQSFILFDLSLVLNGERSAFAELISCVSLGRAESVCGVLKVEVVVSEGAHRAHRAH